MTIREAVAKYVGIPYKHNGRSLDGVDCLGLIHMFYCDLGINIPDSDGKPVLENWYEYDPERYLRGLVTVGRPVTGQLRPLDLVYFRFKEGIVRHTGVMVTPFSFIHVREGKPVMVSPMNGFWLRHLAGARRLI